MEPDVKNEIDRIANSVAEVTQQSPKLKDKRVGKSDFVKAAEKFLDLDISEIKRRAKQDAKRKVWRAIGDVLIGTMNIIFNSPSRPNGGNSSGGGSVIRQADGVSYKAYNQMSGNSGNSGGGKSNRLEFPDLVYDTWDDADEIKRAAEAELMRNGGKLSVAKFYDIFGDVSHLEMTDSMIGWTDLTNAYIALENGKYRLYMPQVESLR